MNIQKTSVTFRGENPRILITGATGYIGSNLTAKLAKEGYDLTICGRNTTKLEFLKELLERINETRVNKNKHNFVNFELTDAKETDKILNENCDIAGVIHLAALNSNAYSMTHPEETYKTNLLGSVNLLNAMLDKDIKKIVFISTGSTYGQFEKTIKIGENLSQHPKTPYAKSKVLAEQIIQDYKKSGLQSIILRLFNVAGAGTKEDMTIGANVISIILNRLKNGTQFILNGNRHKTPDGTTVRDFLHISDVCEAIKSSFIRLSDTTESNIYNVGSGKGTSLGEIIDLSEKTSGKKLDLVINDTPEYEPATLIVDNSKIKNELGWTPHFDIKDIISDAWEWCKIH